MFTLSFTPKVMRDFEKGQGKIQSFQLALPFFCFRFLDAAFSLIVPSKHHHDQLSLSFPLLFTFPNLTCVRCRNRSKCYSIYIICWWWSMLFSHRFVYRSHTLITIKSTMIIILKIKLCQLWIKASREIKDTTLFRKKIIIKAPYLII